MEDFSKAPLRVRFCENGSFFVGSHGICGGNGGFAWLGSSV